MFIQMVKYSFFNQRSVYQSLRLVIFSSRNSSVQGSFPKILVEKIMSDIFSFLHALASRLLGPCLLVVGKMLSFSCVCSLKMGLLKPVLFDIKQ